MAKAKAETSLWSELFQLRLFKPSQGRVVRQVTGFAVASVFVIAAWRLYATVLSDIGATTNILGLTVPGNLIRLGLPVVIALVGAWVSYRLVNWPTFANFLISVEAEMDKVSWASMDYLKRATAVVLVLMVFMGAYLFVCDLFWQQLFVWIGFLDSSVSGS
jgi:preprotein translocase, SecE subunit, bacterial